MWSSTFILKKKKYYTAYYNTKNISISGFKQVETAAAEICKNIQATLDQMILHHS